MYISIFCLVIKLTYQFTILYILGFQDKITICSIRKYIYYLQSVYYKD